MCVILFIFFVSQCLRVHSSSGGLGGGRLDLGAGQVGTAGLRVLGVVVGDGGLDGILSKHGAVDYSKMR